MSPNLLLYRGETNLFNTKYSKTSLNYPSSVASTYDTRPGNEVGLSYNEDRERESGTDGGSKFVHPFRARVNLR